MNFLDLVILNQKDLTQFESLRSGRSSQTTTLFTDIVGFTKLTANLSPEELVWLWKTKAIAKWDFNRRDFGAQAPKIFGAFSTGWVL